MIGIHFDSYRPLTIQDGKVSLHRVKNEHKYKLGRNEKK